MTVAPISAAGSPDAPVPSGPSGLDAEFAALIGLTSGSGPGPGAGPGTKADVPVGHVTGNSKGHDSGHDPGRSKKRGDQAIDASLSLAAAQAGAASTTAGAQAGPTLPAHAAKTTHAAAVTAAGTVAATPPPVAGVRATSSGVVSPVLPQTARALAASRAVQGATPGTTQGTTQGATPGTTPGTAQGAAQGAAHGAAGSTSAPGPTGVVPGAAVTHAGPVAGPHESPPASGKDHGPAARGEPVIGGTTTPGPVAGSLPVHHGPQPGAQPAAPTPPPGHAPTIPDQVHGEVTRLISRGEGTHRITLRLHPADLGDVRVTLTLKDGSVNVSLAAGHDAQKALASGAPELHRLLHAAGATSADIVVKDLPVPTSSRFDLDPGSTGQGRGHTPEQTARTWSGDDGTPARATKPPPANPGTRTPSPGVDVSM